jgi:integrase
LLSALKIIPPTSQSFTHFALLIAANTHPKLLQSRLGHTSIKTTLDIYGQLYEPLDEVAADHLIADAIADRARAERGLER